MLRLRQSRGINKHYIIPIWLCDTGLNLPLTNYWLDLAGDLWLNDQGKYIGTIITCWMKLQTCVRAHLQKYVRHTCDPVFFALSF